MEINIRNCTEKDFDAIFQLSKELRYTKTEKVIAFRRFNSLLKIDLNMILVAECNGRVVGWLHSFVAYRLASEPFMEIGGMVVSSDFRRKGIGTLLVERFIKLASEQKLKIRIRCNITRADTHHFYRELGFLVVKTQHVFELQNITTMEKQP